jgi:hypothetical protein
MVLSRPHAFPHLRCAQAILWCHHPHHRRGLRSHRCCLRLFVAVSPTPTAVPRPQPLLLLLPAPHHHLRLPVVNVQPTHSKTPTAVPPRRCTAVGWCSSTSSSCSADCQWMLRSTPSAALCLCSACRTRVGSLCITNSLPTSSTCSASSPARLFHPVQRPRWARVLPLKARRRHHAQPPQTCRCLHPSPPRVLTSRT